MFVFRKIWRALFSCNTRFEIRPFAILPTIWFNVNSIHVNSIHFKPMKTAKNLFFMLLGGIERDQWYEID